MKLSFQQTFLVFIFLSSSRIIAQSIEYRCSIMDEGSYNVLNKISPLNFNNQIVPQPAFGHTSSGNLFLESGVFSSSLGMITNANNLSAPTYNYSIRECALDISLSDEVDILAGKKILKWGTGYAFNPTSVVEPKRSPSDPADRLNQFEGLKLIALSIFHQKNSLAFVYLNDVQIKNSSIRWNAGEYAFRAYTFISGIDLSLIGHYKEGDRFEAGGNFSYVVGDQLEIHGEVLAKKGSSMPYHLSITDTENPQEYSSYPYVSCYDGSRKIFYKAIIGSQYTFDNGINLAIEYYHNSEGLNNQQWKRWMNFVMFQDEIQKGIIIVPTEIDKLSFINLLWSLNTLSPQGTMCDYLFGRGFYSDGNWSIELISFINADDWSAALIPTVTARISQYFSPYIRYTMLLGKNDSEFGCLFLKGTLNLGIGVQF